MEYCLIYLFLGRTGHDDRVAAANDLLGNIVRIKEVNMLFCWSSPTSTPDPWKLSPSEDHERELLAMTILSKLFVPLTRINNKTPVTMVCTKRDSNTGMLWSGKRIPPGGHIYLEYRKDASYEYEYWFHVEGRDHDEGERVFPYTVYKCAEFDIEPSSSSLLGFNLVQRIGPLLGRFLVSRLAKSYGLGCLADPFAIPDPTTPTAVDPDEASTTLVAPEVQLVVNRGQDPGATLSSLSSRDT